MQLAKVLGDVVATRKDERLQNLTLLVLQPLGADGSPLGRRGAAGGPVSAGYRGRRSFLAESVERKSPARERVVA